MAKENMRRFDVRLRKQDDERLALICETFGVSKADAVRAALVALSRQLGHDREFSNDLMKKN